MRRRGWQVVSGAGVGAWLEWARGVRAHGSHFWGVGGHRAGHKSGDGGTGPSCGPRVTEASREHVRELPHTRHPWQVLGTQAP